MVKKVNGFYLPKNIKHKYLVKVRPFSSAKTSSMHDHAKPTIREINPEHIILRVGTNDLKPEKTNNQTANSVIELMNSLKNETISIHVSLIVPRNDNLNNKVNEVNNHLTNMCQQRNIKVISYTNTIDPAKHLNESQLHLNEYGTIEFAKNFKNFKYNLNWRGLDNSERFDQYEANFPNLVRNTLHSGHNENLMKTGMKNQNYFLNIIITMITII